MNLTDLQTMARKDMVIDEELAGEESLKSAALHQKYLDILLNELMVLRRQEADLKMLRRELWLYYSGKASDDVYKKRGLWQHHVLKTDLDMFIESDGDYVALNLKVDVQREKVAYLESIIKQLANRNWQIRNYIEWVRFRQGQL